MTVRMRHTRSHSKNRRSHHALTKRNILKDEDGKLRLPHRIDEATGMYRGKLIVSPKAEKESKTEKAKKGEKEEHAVGVNEPVHADTEDAKKPAGLMGRMMKGRAKARSGMGGGAS